MGQVYLQLVDDVPECILMPGFVCLVNTVAEQRPKVAKMLVKP